MARVILDVPTEKMKSFIRAVLRLGIDRHAISSTHLPQKFPREKRRGISLKRIASSYILFDWEFFSNELEYE
ncbi:MAG: hypothetical protein NVSMB63_14250 [Sediminibacterium sp.]